MKYLSLKWPVKMETLDSLNGLNAITCYSVKPLRTWLTLQQTHHSGISSSTYYNTMNSLKKSLTIYFSWQANKMSSQSSLIYGIMKQINPDSLYYDKRWRLQNKCRTIAYYKS